MALTVSPSVSAPTDWSSLSTLTDAVFCHSAVEMLLESCVREWKVTPLATTETQMVTAMEMATGMASTLALEGKGTTADECHESR